MSSINTSDPKTKQYVFCIKWGTLYGAEYVNRLYSMIDRNLTVDYEFVCFTDNTDGLYDNIKTYPLPPLGVDHPKNVPGKWTKTALWQADLFGLKGVALFVDLDTVIVDNIDCFFEHGDPQDVVVTRNWLKPAQKLGQTTLFRYPIGGNAKVYNDFQLDPQNIADKYQFEQHYVTAQMGKELKFWPKTWVKHYRIHCLTNNYVKRYFKAATIPKGAKIIAFPGWPNPDFAAKGIWQKKQLNHPTPIDHIKDAFTKEKRVSSSFIGHLKSYHKPCEWVLEEWKIK